MKTGLGLSEHTLFNMPLVSASRDAACVSLLDGERRRVAFINADCVNIAARDKSYVNALDTMDALLPDGSGLALAAMMQGKRFDANLNGTDLFPVLCEAARDEGKSVYFLGGKPGIADAAAANAVARVPGLIVAGTADGYFDAEDEGAVVEAINASGADILLVAMGVPVQEHFIARHSAALKPSVCMGVGGLFDFVAGAVPRAPAPVRAVGMEWAWRLACEPKRLAKRYLLGNPAFILRAMHDALSAGVFGYANRKRAMDIFMSSVAMLLLSPFFILTALAICFESRGGAFFSQIRVGKDGKPFRMYKFRTMYPDAETRLAAIRGQSDRDSVCFKMADDPRVTRVGKLLRKTSLDEFPQLLNVLFGQMSMVGPRPALPSEVAQYSEYEMQRLSGRPGISCLWQISGRADLKFDKQVDLDIAYLRSSSTWLDIAIIILTPLAIISRRGAY